MEKEVRRNVAEEPGAAPPSRLRERFRAAVSELHTGASAPRRESRSKRAPSKEDLPPIEKLLGGSWEKTDLGEVFIRDEWFSMEHQHGDQALGSALQATRQENSPALRLVAPSLFPQATDSSGALPATARLGFFDIETTGTSGATGTYIFLAGLGAFVGQRFRLRQYFLANLSQETAMLSLLLHDLGELEGIVTYNGRTFDVPCLQTRATLARLPSPPDSLAHLDLLPAVRRLHRHRLESCRLSVVERELLGFHRDDDVPGWLVPSLYFDYIKAQRVTPMRGVFRHNRDDILSLVATLSAVSLFLAKNPENGEDSVAFARLWERAHYPKRAARLYRQALSQLEGRELWPRTAHQHALLCKRRGARDEAVGLWERLWSDGDRMAGIELAKHHEHRSRDLNAALAITQTLLLDASADEQAALEHRLRRLQRKLARTRRS